MFRRIVLSAAVLAGLAGCGAGTRLQVAVDVGQWTPDFSGSALRSGGSSFNLVGQGGVADDDPFWFFDSSFRMVAPRGRQVQPFALDFGYCQNTYEGTGPGGVTFAGADLGPGTRTRAEFKLYKFGYEEMRPTEGTSGLTGGLIGLHYLDFDITATDDAGNTGTFSDGAPMLVFGWRVTYVSRGITYYFGVEGMDLDSVSLENVGGNLMDIYGGLRWAIHGNRAALSVGYRKYEADLSIRSDRLSIEMDGYVVSLYMSF